MNRALSTSPRATGLSTVCGKETSHWNEAGTVSSRRDEAQSQRQLAHEASDERKGTTWTNALVGRRDHKLQQYHEKLQAGEERRLFMEADDADVQSNAKKRHEKDSNVKLSRRDTRAKVIMSNMFLEEVKREQNEQMIHSARVKEQELEKQREYDNFVLLQAAREKEQKEMERIERRSRAEKDRLEVQKQLEATKQVLVQRRGEEQVKEGEEIRQAAVEEEKFRQEKKLAQRAQAAEVARTQLQQVSPRLTPRQRVEQRMLEDLPVDNDSLFNERKIEIIKKQEEREADKRHKRNALLESVQSTYQTSSPGRSRTDRMLESNMAQPSFAELMASADDRRKQTAQEKKAYLSEQLQEQLESQANARLSENEKELKLQERLRAQLLQEEALDHAEKLRKHDRDVYTHNVCGLQVKQHEARVKTEKMMSEKEKRVMDEMMQEEEQMFQKYVQTMIPSNAVPSPVMMKHAQRSPRRPLAT